MKRPVYNIETDCDIDINIQVTTPFINTENGKHLLPDEICIVANDYGYDLDEPIYLRISSYHSIGITELLRIPREREGNRL